MKKAGSTFSLIGPGRVGTSIGMALVESGWICDFIVAQRDERSEVRTVKAHFPGAFVTGSLSSLRQDFDLLLLTVSDDKIEYVCEELSEHCSFSWEGKVVLHASGIVEVDKLDSLKAKGASTGAFHPVAPFASRYSPDSARGIHYDFLGGRIAGAMAGKIARSLSSEMIRLKSEHERTLFHIASVMVSNFTVIAVRSAEELVSKFLHESEAKSLLGGLLSSTVQNLSRREGMSSLTGPLTRGDINVILKHLQSLETDPQLLQFYRSSSLLGLDLLLKDERDMVRRRKLSQIKKMLEG